VSGALDGLRVLEIAGQYTAYPSKVLADMGADTIVIEPPGGAATRVLGPFADDRPGPEESLHWRHYNTSKRSVVLDLTDEADRARLRRLLVDCDVLLEGLPERDLTGLGLTPEGMATAFPSLRLGFGDPVRATRRAAGQPDHRSHSAGRRRPGAQLRV